MVDSFAASPVVNVGGSVISKGRKHRGVPASYEWSDTNLPWSYLLSYIDPDAPDYLYSGFGVVPDVPTVPLVTSHASFYENVMATLDSQTDSAVVISLPEGIYSLDTFHLSDSNDLTTAYALYDSRLAGFIGSNPDTTIIQLLPNAKTVDPTGSDRTSEIKTMPDYSSLNRCVIHLAGASTQQSQISSHVSYFNGISLRAYAQPLPHHGLSLDSDQVSLTVVASRFIGAAQSINDVEGYTFVSSGDNYYTFNGCELTASFDNTLCSCFSVGSPLSFDVAASWVRGFKTPIYQQPSASSQSTSSAYVSFHACTILAESLVFDLSSARTRFSLGESLVEVSSGSVLVHTSDLPQSSTDASIQITGLRVKFLKYPHLSGYAIVSVPSDSAWVYYGEVYNAPISASNEDGLYYTLLAPVYWDSTKDGVWPPSDKSLRSLGVSPDTHFIVVRER